MKKTLLCLATLLFFGCGKKIDLDQKERDEKEASQVRIKEQLQNQFLKFKKGTKCLSPSDTESNYLITKYIKTKKFKEKFSSNIKYEFILLKGGILLVNNLRDPNYKIKKVAKNCKIEAAGLMRITYTSEGLIKKIKIRGSSQRCTKIKKMKGLISLLGGHLEANDSSLIFKKAHTKCKKKKKKEVNFSKT